MLAQHNRTAAVWLNNQAFEVYSSKGASACILKIYGVAALQAIVVSKEVRSASITLYVAQWCGRYLSRRGLLDACLLAWDAGYVGGGGRASYKRSIKIRISHGGSDRSVRLREGGLTYCD